MASSAPIIRVEASAYTIPTDAPEADGTFAWDSTTLVVAKVEAGGSHGIGYTYADPAAAAVIRNTLAGAVLGIDAMSIPAAHQSMLRRVRNIGRAGIAATAISAVDTALWDLKGRLLGVPVVSLLGAARDVVHVYGSGGFTTYSNERLRDQLGTWASEGMRWVKMKVGSVPADDLARVSAVREVTGPAQLFVDANGAYRWREALAWAGLYGELGVVYFEEPVSSDDLDGLHFVRERCPAGMKIAAGEYGYDLFYFRQMLRAQAVDVLQADVTRCLGITGLLQVDALCTAHSIPLALHCAPALHLHAALASRALWNQEWFHDHVRIERMLFDGAPEARKGVIAADLSRPGLGLEFKRQDAERYAV